MIAFLLACGVPYVEPIELGAGAHLFNESADVADYAQFSRADVTIAEGTIDLPAGGDLELSVPARCTSSCALAVGVGDGIQVFSPVSVDEPGTWILE